MGKHTHCRNIKSAFAITVIVDFSNENNSINVERAGLCFGFMQDVMWHWKRLEKQLVRFGSGCAVAMKGPVQYVCYFQMFFENTEKWNIYSV